MLLIIMNNCISQNSYVLCSKYDDMIFKVVRAEHVLEGDYILSRTSGIQQVDKIKVSIEDCYVVNGNTMNATFTHNHFSEIFPIENVDNYTSKKVLHFIDKDGCQIEVILVID